MGQMRKDLDGYRTTSPPQRSAYEWANEFNPGEQEHMEAAFQVPKTGGFVPSGFAPADFQKFEAQRRLFSSVGSPPSQMSSSFYRPAMGTGYRPAMGMMGSPYSPMSMQGRPSEQTTQTKGKGRMVELDEKDWEAQFAEMDKAGQEGQHMDAEANATMEHELDQMDRSVPPFSETGVEDAAFESIWRDIEAYQRPPHSLLNHDHTKWDQTLDPDSTDLLSDFNWDSFDSQFTDRFRDPQLGNYTFEQDNPFTATNINPFEEGLAILRDGGNLSLAALAFEAAVQQDPQHIAAWSHLGSAQAQNEKEAPAIRALEQCLKLDPTNLPALMSLAISYTNEGYESTAYRTLERWLATKYPAIVSPSDLTPDADFGFTDRHALHDKITDAFIRAAQLRPSGSTMDPDVQVGLGVLFYGAEEYDKAVDCFEAALQSAEEGSSNSQGQAHLLWNRLGATLANSNRSEQAIAAYERALELRPNFVRARYNLGVSCINIGVFEQAAQHLLGALAMHRVVEREGMERVRGVMGGADVQEGEVERMVAMNQSTNLLETLKRVFVNMERRDLAERVEVGMDVEGFRGEFDF
ncbi:MAG: Peroxisomal membrane signal receptor PTS1 [Ramalina farinacea]|uniref:Peroxisomal targeting signal receptor n=1 Tax=Ramalina farinacea TaxID=258253 RepID=A0AA43TXA6_9LECA|nr:Peroxisomal membrane signal receptor PTS1 [Ramalina farinacea]